MFKDYDFSSPWVGGWRSLAGYYHRFSNTEGFSIIMLFEHRIPFNLGGRSKSLMPPLWCVKRLHHAEEWGPTPTPGLDCNWWATGERFLGVLHLSTEVFQAILTELTINTQPNTKEADSFQSFVHESQVCITAGCLCQVWIHQQWALVLGSWGSHLRHNSLPASWRMRRVSHSQLTKSSHPPVFKSWFLFGESRLKASSGRGGLQPRSVMDSLGLGPLQMKLSRVSYALFTNIV